METDINVPKTKSVNIFIQFAKMQFYCAVISFILPHLITQANESCSDNGMKLINLNYKGSVAMILLNVVALLFIWLRDPFARLEFFVMYTVNICWSGLMGFQAYMDYMLIKDDCASVGLAEKLIIFFHVKVQLEVLYTFICPIPFAFRTIHFPTSLYALTILFMIDYSQNGCSQDYTNIEFAMIFINAILFGVGVPLNFALLCTQKATGPNLFRFLLMLGIIGQGGIIALMYQSEVVKSKECIPCQLIFQSYPLIIACAMIFSLTSMMSLPAYDHDEIRLRLLKQRLRKPQQENNNNAGISKIQNINQQQDQLGKSRTVINDGKSMYGTVIKR